MANTLKFFGVPFGKEPIPDANKIWAFTLGDITNDGWDSDKANNVEYLIKEIKAKRDSNKKLHLAIPIYANHTVNFNLFKGRKEDRLAINIFDGKTFLNTIEYLDIEVLDNGIPVARNEVKAGYMIYPIYVGGNVRIN